MLDTRIENLPGLIADAGAMLPSPKWECGARSWTSVDAYVWFDEIHDMNPLPGEVRPGESAAVEETYSFEL